MISTSCQTAPPLPHLPNIFIRHWDPRRSRPHLTAFDMRGGANLIVNKQQFLRFRSAHHTSGAVAARTERLFVTQPAHDKSFSPPSNRMIPELSPRRAETAPLRVTYRSSPKCCSFLHIVMVAVDPSISRATSFPRSAGAPPARFPSSPSRFRLA